MQKQKKPKAANVFDNLLEESPKYIFFHRLRSAQILRGDTPALCVHTLFDVDHFISRYRDQKSCCRICSATRSKPWKQVTAKNIQKWQKALGAKPVLVVNNKLCMAHFPDGAKVPQQGLNGLKSKPNPTSPTALRAKKRSRMGTRDIKATRASLHVESPPPLQVTKIPEVELVPILQEVFANQLPDVNIRRLITEFPIVADYIGAFSKERIALLGKITHLQEEVIRLSIALNESQRFRFRDELLSSDKKLKYWCNAPSLEDAKILVMQIGFFPEDGLALSKLTSEAWDDKTKCVPKSVRKTDVTALDWLIILLIKLAHGLTDQQLADLWSVSPAEIGKGRLAMAQHLYHHCKSAQYIRWFTKEEHARNTPDRVREEIGKLYPDMPVRYVDATYIYLESPGDFETQNITWNDNKHANLVKIKAIVSSWGKVEALSTIVPGRTSDATMWNESHMLRDLVRQADRLLPCVMGMDKGYDSILVPDGVNVLMPTKSGSAQFTDEENDITRLAASHRVTVECVFGIVKEQWSVAGDQQPMAGIHNLEYLLYIVFSLYNKWNKNRV